MSDNVTENIIQFYDAHCHPGFAENPAQLMAHASKLGISGFANTVVPQEYIELNKFITKTPKISEISEASKSSESLVDQRKSVPFDIGVGLHPWWIAQEKCGEEEVCQAEVLAKASKYIGEIGLDFSPRFAGTEQAQMDAFQRIVTAAVSDAGNVQKIFSIHSVKAATAVMDCLEQIGVLPATGEGKHKVIFHWFSGSSDELQRAIKLGCYFSVNLRMLKSKRGREYACVIPEDKILLETDLPAENDAEFNAEIWCNLLSETAQLLHAIRE